LVIYAKISIKETRGNIKQMDQQGMHFNNKVFKSITDFSFYENFLAQTTGKAIKYLLLLTITVGVLWLIRPIYEFNTGITSIVYSFHNEIPDFTFSNGQLTVEGKMPIILENGDQFFLIDTSGKTDESILKSHENAIFVSRDKLVQKKNNFETRNFNFKDLQGMNLTKADVETFLPLLRWINVLIIVFGLLWFFLSKLFSALLLSIIGLILNGIKNANMDFSNLYKLSIYSLTLPVVIKVLCSGFSISIPHFWILYYTIGSVYLWNAIKVKKAPIENF
jgi:hypothetical protein